MSTMLSVLLFNFVVLFGICGDPTRLFPCLDFLNPGQLTGVFNVLISQEEMLSLEVVYCTVEQTSLCHGNTHLDLKSLQHTE